MYIQEFLAGERQHERLRQAEEKRIASQVAELRKAERRRQRVERELAQARHRLEQLQSMISEAS